MALIKQHLIDPEICIRCNTCEAICPINAITHDERNYVVKAEACNSCMACISPCPTGAIDNWRTVDSTQAYPIAAQLGWDALPAELSTDQLTANTPEAAPSTAEAAAVTISAAAPAATKTVPIAYAATLPPWSAAHPYAQLYGPKAPEKFITAKVVGNVRVTEVGSHRGADYDTHHLVLDFGQLPFPVLEGQSIAILPPGVDAQGRAHHPRQYSIASPRNGERAGYNNLSLTVKRVLEDHSGKAVRGVASNYLCDLKIGDTVQVIGPFGTSFLMPNHPHSHIVMICTGTGSAPMRAMTEWRRRLRAKALNSPSPEQGFRGGKLILFFGARTQEELPYFGPLQNLPKDFIDIHFAFSRIPQQAKRYVQDVMRERAADLLPLLSDPNTYFYVCGLQAMEDGVLLALKDIAEQGGLNWSQLAAAFKREGRLHLETY